MADVAIMDWLHHEFGVVDTGVALARPHAFDPDSFITAVRKALPRSRKLSAADVARLKQEHTVTIEPARVAAREAMVLERRLSDLVNTAYGLTREDVALLWKTAPPRMPFMPNK
jgi:DNA-binding NarL/FixJ family response regulator